MYCTHSTNVLCWYINMYQLYCLHIREADRLAVLLILLVTASAQVEQVPVYPGPKNGLRSRRPKVKEQRPPFKAHKPFQSRFAERWRQSCFAAVKRFQKENMAQFNPKGRP